ncbi:MAG: thioesterase family protein [Vampirovibrionales bacterium]|nr:thioesterase family protein [Vampirovibrionales bacterium]
MQTYSNAPHTPEPASDRAMLHDLMITVQIFDTDCYGVMWHGAYAKWLEQARVQWLRQRGIDLSQPPYAPPEAQWLFPVASQQLTYKAPARFGQTLQICSQAQLLGRNRIVFEQTCTIVPDNTLTLTAQTVCVVIDNRWRPVRMMPEALQAVFSAPPAETFLEHANF